MIRRKLGRKPRSYSPRIPHYSALRMRGVMSAPPPAARAWSKGLPDNLGFYLNDQIGNCADAAVYHRRQVQSFVTTGVMDTQPDNMALSLYEKEGGYVPGDSSTDNGTGLQDLLTYWYNTGIPLADGTTEKLIAFFEVDPTNPLHVKEVINDCGGIYLGINLPQAIEDNNYPNVWDVTPGSPVAGGHCIYGVDYGVSPDTRFLLDGITVNSWGEWNLITPQTWSYIEEAYALVTNTWVTSTGKTPLNMTVQELEEQMQPLKD
jgi:hypothetical protein